jgi:hypothetical protein
MNQNALLALLSAEDVSRRIAEIQTTLQKNLSSLDRALLERELEDWQAMSLTDTGKEEL